MSLRHIIGTTARSNAGLSSNPESGEVAYIAGAAVVIYSTVTNEQVAYLTTPSSKPITCLAYAPDGEFIAAGEAAPQPCVVVWSTRTQKVVAEMRGHKSSVVSLTWSHTLKYIASVGCDQDSTLNIWNWRAGKLAACSPLSARVCSVGAKADGTFITSGHRHVKFWSLRRPAGSQAGTTQLEGRVAHLGAERDSVYVGVVGGPTRDIDDEYVYSLTTRGLLCLLNSGRTIERYVDVKPGADGHAFAVAVSTRCIAVGCSSGVVRLFAPNSLQYITTLPKPAACGRLNTKQHGQDLTPSCDARQEAFPDAVSISMPSDGKQATVIYSDNSMYVWDIADTDNVGQLQSSLAHAGAVWDVDMVPSTKMPGQVLPPGTFATASADSTVRFWNIDRRRSRRADERLKGQCSRYSQELVSVVYCGMDPTFEGWKARDPDLVDQTAHHAEPHPEHVELRCLCISKNATFVASGDRMGNIRVHELASNQLYAFHEAHDSEVIAIDFSPPLADPNDNGSTRTLLASASSDSLVHVYDSDTNYKLDQTTDEHTGAVTGLRFAVDTQNDTACRLMTCGADESVTFRQVQQDKKGALTVLCDEQTIVSGGSLHDLVVTHDGRYAVTAGADRSIKVWSVQTGAVVRTIVPDGKAQPIKVVLDPSDSLMAVSGSDRGVRLYDFQTGELHYKVRGHSELVTAMSFSTDGSELVTVSADCCIFIWQIGSALRKLIRQRLAKDSFNSTDKSAVAVLKPSENSPRAPAVSLKQFSSKIEQAGETNVQVSDAPCINLSETLLPKWAKDASIEVAHRKVKSEDVRPVGARDSNTSGSENSSRWAEHVQTDLYSEANRWDDLVRSQECSNTQSDEANAISDDIDSTKNQADGVVVSDVITDDDGEDDTVVYFEQQTLAGKNSTMFEVTQPIVDAHSLESEPTVEGKSRPCEPILDQRIDLLEEPRLPSWLRHDVPQENSTAWAAHANQSMRQSLSSQFRASREAGHSLAAVGASVTRLTLKEEREALKNAEASNMNVQAEHRLSLLQSVSPGRSRGRKTAACPTTWTPASRRRAC